MTVQNTLRDAVDGAEGAGGAMDDDLASAQERRSAKQAEEGVKDSKRSKKGQEHVSYDDDDEEEEEEEDDADSDAEGSSKGKKKGGKKAASKDGEEADGSDSSDSDSDASGSDSDGDEEDGDESKSSARKSKKAARPSAAAEVDQSIRTFITMMAPQWNRHTYIDKVVFDVPETASGAEDDATAPGWFEVRVVTEPGQPKLLMLSLVEKVIAQCLVRQTKGITKAVVLERSVKGVKERYVQTAGVNFRAAVAHPEADASRLKCNDIWALLRTYGVEAARAAIKEEISGVFAVYGIGVDPRHLLLIADYMTFWGSYTPMNRMGMEQHVSVLQKATFETSLKFVIDACLRGDTDDCRSPSTAIVLGKPIPSGTSAFGLLQPITGF
jgi:DNA-directed RNA polymerase I subunit RPA1